MRARPHEALRVLRLWTYPSQQTETDEALTEALLTTYTPDTLDALDGLREAPQFVRSMNRTTGNAMMIPVVLEELTKLKGYMV